MQPGYGGSNQSCIKNSAKLKNLPNDIILKIKLDNIFNVNPSNFTKIKDVLVPFSSLCMNFCRPRISNETHTVESVKSILENKKV